MGLPSFLTLRRDALIARLLMAGFTRVSDDKGRFLFLDFYDGPGGIVPVPLWDPDTMKAAEFEDCLDRGEAVCAIVEMQQMFRFDAKPSLFHVELPAKDPLAYLQDHGWYNQGTIAFDDLGTPIYCPAVPPSKDPGPFRSIPGGVAAFDHTVSPHPSQKVL